MMTRFPEFLAFGAALVFLSGTFSLVAQEKNEESESWEGQTVVVELGNDDLEDGRRLREWERLLERADEEEAAMVIFEIDVDLAATADLAKKVADISGRFDGDRVAFVNSTATGLGALVALSAQKIYVTESAIIGGASPAMGAGAEEDESVREARLRQERSIIKARARNLAKQNEHSVEVAEAMVDESVVLDWAGETLSGDGDILTLTADEAVLQFEGNPLLAVGIADSIADLLKMEGSRGAPLAMTPRDFGESANRARLAKSNRSESKEEADESADSEESESLFGRRDEGSYKGKVIVLKVGEDTLATGRASFDFMERTIKKAELDEAAALIFDMDTPGGIAWYTDGLVLNSLQNVSYPTYTFVNSRAESAGAIIALGTDHIYMRPAATIGSALVVSATGGDLAEDLSDKVTQMIIGSVRNVAELKGHNPDVAEAFVTRDKEVRIDGTVVHEAGNVLNLNTIRATEEIGGKPVLAKGAANEIDDILAAEGIEAEVILAEPLGMEAFAHWVQKLSILLIVVGLAGAYLELNSPGFGLPGLVSVLSFGLFFFGNYLAGNLAGYELAVLLILGLILIGVEVFVFPGAIVPGAVGGALVLVALGLAMVDRVDLEWKWEGMPGAESWFSIFRGSFIGLAIGLVGSLGLILAGMKFLPQTKMGNRFILEEAVASGHSIEGLSNGEEKASLLGTEGIATTDLVPSGKGRFGDRVLDIISNGEFIQKESPVRVVQEEGSRIVVSRTS
ncbi:MAG: NfeD family protein [Verrucomicrobiota bacterium]